MVWDNTLERTGVDTQSTQQLHDNVFFVLQLSEPTILMTVGSHNSSILLWIGHLMVQWAYEMFWTSVIFATQQYFRIASWDWLCAWLVGIFLLVVGLEEARDIFWLIPTQTPISAALSEARFVQLPPRLGWLPRASFDRANHSLNVTAKRYELWRYQKWVVWETQESLRRNSMPRERK